ncbi:MAG TPA: CYCXC family (seleno)protein [Candidatus Binataceae bacterium]|jgi:hypothetical protein|nr:CYCXC family (seleno)protein [Candidatus Binataceae bacterium]
MAKGKVGATGNRRPWIFAAVAALAMLFVGVGLWTMRSAADSPAPEEQKSPTLDPSLFSGEARTAYEIAAKNPALLAQLHCYCGCDKELGHQSLLDCYRDQHGAQCPICTGEAVEAAKLADEGLPIEQIRRVLRDHWGHGD